MDRNEFKEKAKQQIDDIFAKIGELEAKQMQVEAQGKVEFEKNLQSMKELKTELEKKYDDLETATDEKWEEVKETFSSSADSFKEGFSKIFGLFR